MLQYLYHFETSVESQEEQRINSTNTKVVPVVTAYVHEFEMHRIKLSPEELLNDSTCNYGATGDQKFNECMGRCPDGHAITFLRAFMAETKFNFLFIFQFVLPIVYGDLMKLLVSVIMDGNKEAHSAARQALESGFFGTEGITFISTCFFHAVTQKIVKDYLSQLAGISQKVFNTDGFQKAISETASTDGGIGLLVYYWVKWIIYEVKTRDLCMQSFEDLNKFINGKKFSEKYTFIYPDPGVYGPKHKVALETFVREVFGNFPLMCSAYNLSPVNFGTKCTSGIEGDFAVKKRLGLITSKTTPTNVVRHEEDIANLRELAKEVTIHRDAFAVPTHLRTDENGHVLRLLTPLAREKLQREIAASSDWSVTRIAVDKFALQLSEESILKRLNRGVPQHPQLFNWVPEHEKSIITVKEDSNGFLRLQCGCFTCKSNIPCRRIIAIKAGRVDQVDVHFRYFVDFLNGTYPFLTRTVQDLTAFQGAAFFPADNARHMIVVAPSALSSSSSTSKLDDAPMSEVNIVVFVNVSFVFAYISFFTFI